MVIFSSSLRYQRVDHSFSPVGFFKQLLNAKPWKVRRTFHPVASRDVWRIHTKITLALSTIIQRCDTMSTQVSPWRSQFIGDDKPKQWENPINQLSSISLNKVNYFFILFKTQHTYILKYIYRERDRYTCLMPHIDGFTFQHPDTWGIRPRSAWWPWELLAWMPWNSRWADDRNFISGYHLVMTNSSPWYRWPIDL